ncbi:hypothetical protein [Enhygromyxa salina]|uniref:hypothetical protein n=1 Tax=Enhygromyxa salina TaxID=215803 RepID=UPI0011BA5324|nr:hypothetical protein [Enhygromyxa salina]
MEDPIKFDLWGVASSTSKRWLAEKIASVHPEVSRADVLRKIAGSIRSNAPVLFSAGRGWSNSVRERLDAAEKVSDVEVFQESYGPDGKANLEYCEEHLLFYGGCLGCPVCGRRHQQ